MLFTQHEDTPLRIYIEECSETDILRLDAELCRKFGYEDQYSQGRESNDIDSLIFKDEEGKSYFPAGIIGILKNAALSLGYSVCENLLQGTAESMDSIVVEDTILDSMTLRGYQVESIKAALLYKRGLIVSPTGSGKSSMMLGVCRYLFNNYDCNILICVPSSYLLHQTYDNAIRAGIKEKDISRYGDGHEFDPNKRILIATIQTLNNRLKTNHKKFIGWVDNLKCLIIDEVQHCAARTYYEVIDRLQTEYVLGYSAEPFYNNKENMIRDLITRGIIGSVIYKVSMNYLVEMGYISRPYVIALSSKYKGNMFKLIDWHSVYKTGIVQNKLRNDMIISSALELIDEGKNPLILVQQIKHGQALAESISNGGRKVVMLTGGSTVTVYLDGMVIDTYKDDEGIVRKQFQDGLIDAMIGTSVADEGMDFPILSSVILAGGQKSTIKILQRIGRGLRRKDTENFTFIVDFTDTFNVVLKSHFNKRKQLYDSNKIPVYIANDTSSIKTIINTIRNMHC